MVELATMTEKHMRGVYKAIVRFFDEVDEKWVPDSSELSKSCLALGYMYSSTDDAGRVTFHHSVCDHPKRNGPVMGCLLVEEDNGGEIKVREGGRCSHKVGAGSEGANDYLERDCELLRFDEIF